MVIIAIIKEKKMIVRENRSKNKRIPKQKNIQIDSHALQKSSESSKLSQSSLISNQDEDEEI